MPRAVDDGMLGPLPPTHARLRTPPRGRAKWVPGGQLVRSRRLLHGRIWPWPGPTVPRPRWSGISLGQEQFGPCQQGPGRWTMGWRGLQKFCASPETLWLLGVIFNKKLRIYYRGGHVVELEISSESVEMENSWATKAICGDFYRPPPPWAEEISGHRSPAVVRRGPANFSGEAPFRTDWTIFAGKNVGRRGPWAVNPLGHHGWGRNHHRPAAVRRAPSSTARSDGSDHICGKNNVGSVVGSLSCSAELPRLCHDDPLRADCLESLFDARRAWAFVALAGCGRVGT